jgi:hypothetical protein
MRESRGDALDGVNGNLVARPRVVRTSGPVCGESASRPRSAHERYGTRRHDPDTRLRLMQKAAWGRARPPDHRRRVTGLRSAAAPLIVAAVVSDRAEAVVAISAK